ncbi:MAG: helix-turn-helix transcriptional regulator, partial [Oxalobacter sp.]|nr:helix-turn-helix transcriptional regulator [Oxalobacter sp.]
MEKIAKRIENCRHSMNISQSELARKIGVTPQAVQKWEKAKNL